MQILTKNDNWNLLVEVDLAVDTLVSGATTTNTFADLFHGSNLVISNFAVTEAAPEIRGPGLNNLAEVHKNTVQAFLRVSSADWPHIIKITPSAGSTGVLVLGIRLTVRGIDPVNGIPNLYNMTVTNTNSEPKTFQWASLQSTQTYTQDLTEYSYYQHPDGSIRNHNDSVSL